MRVEVLLATFPPSLSQHIATRRETKMPFSWIGLAEAFIAETIQSVLAQTHPEIEVIVVDDGLD